jgi:hypothetical protein
MAIEPLQHSGMAAVHFISLSCFELALNAAHPRDSRRGRSFIHGLEHANDLPFRRRRMSCHHSICSQYRQAAGAEGHEG